MLKKRMAYLALCGVMVLTTAGCGNSTETDNTEKEAEAGFSPSLDTETPVELEIAGFMANFEALDQVVNDFNEIYPNVTVNYEANASDGLASYMENNDYVDIFMTADKNVRDPEDTDRYVGNHCQDLSELDTSQVNPEMLKFCTVDGSVVRIPVATTMCGIVVNETLLEQAGVEVPQNYPEFLEACRVLKEKGYTPIQSSKIHACSDLVLPMALNILGNDEKLLKEVQDGDDAFVESLRPVYERLEELMKNGYLDNAVNSEYPDDNYDGAIMKFFEGEVPFWVATTESVSGMKKRESKSETFSANPFSYEFLSAPLGDEGSYVYEEPWYGFSVNKDSDELDYAMEFMKFLVQKDELNQLASIKGMPSASIDSDDDRFTKALEPEHAVSTYVNNGEIGSKINSLIANNANQMALGGVADAETALENIRKGIHE